MIDVAVAAEQLRLAGPVDDDLLLQGMIDAAIQRAADWLDRPLFPAGAMPDPAPPRGLEMTAAIERAVLILVSQAYDNRQGNEDETALGLPREVHSLLSPYRWFGSVV